MPDQRAFFSRGELLDGLPARRASTILFAIESRTATLVSRARDAMASYLNDRTAREREAAFLEAMAQGRTLPVAISVQDLERYAPAWAPLVPGDAGLRAELARLIGGKYRLAAGRVPKITAALGLDDPAVGEAFARRDGAQIRSIFAERTTSRDRLRWWRAATAYRLEHMPPFWMAFALTLTETIGEGVLTVPIAVAGLGPLGGLAALVVLGIVNLVTIGAIVEAISRDGDMRYGSSYFGHLVANYLGRAGTALLAPSILVLDLICLLTYAIGFAAAVSGATGIPAELWVAALLVVNVAVLARGSMSATVASAILVGVVNIVLMLAVCLAAAPHVDLGRLAAGPTGAAGAPFRIADLGIVFGVILVAYFGHTSTGSAAKVVLAEDPSGRALLRGNLAAMATVVGLYCLATVVVLGVVPSSQLVGYPGTPLAPLAAAAGPAVDVFGSLYAMIAIGFGSLYISLSLFNQVREWLPPLAGRTGPSPSGLRRLVGDRRSQALIALLPTVAVFALAEAMFATGTESFTAPLGFLGLLSCALVGGVFPMLMVAVARQRGDIVPGTVVRFIGHPVTVAAVTAVYVGEIALNGLLIWQEPIQRVLAAATAVAALGLALWSYRAGAFRPRSVVQVRVDEAGGARGRLEVASAGRPAAVTVAVETDGGCSSADAAGLDLGRVRSLRSITVGLPDGIARDLKVWVHRITSDGESAAWPAVVTLEDGGATRPVQVDAATGKGIATLHAGTRSLRIEPSARMVPELRL